jgi:putative tryptophan/tyrosine transport system substrate-binding protein
VRRRDFIKVVAGSVAGWPFDADAQQPATPVIGFLCAASASLYADRVRAFRRGLEETGYIESQNVAIEYRWAEDRYDRLPALAADLVRRQVTIITATTAPAALAAKAATGTIPIVFEAAVDPVNIGLVGSLNRPGGNVTGVTSLNVEVARKRLELLHEVLPKVNTIAALVNPASPNERPSIQRSTSGGARSRPAATRPASEHRSGFRYGLCTCGGATCRGACHRRRCIFR